MHLMQVFTALLISEATSDSEVSRVLNESSATIWLSTLPSELWPSLSATSWDVLVIKGSVCLTRSKIIVT